MVSSFLHWQLNRGTMLKNKTHFVTASQSEYFGQFTNFSADFFIERKGCYAGNVNVVVNFV